MAVETTNAAVGAVDAPPAQIQQALRGETSAHNSYSNPANGMDRFKRHLAFKNGQAFDGLRALNSLIHARGLSPLASMTPGFGGHEATPGFSGQWNSQPGVQGDGFVPSMGPTAGFSGMSGVQAYSNVGASGHWNPDSTGRGEWAGVTAGDLSQKPLGHFSDGTGVYHPLGSGPSPFIPGMSAFWDWYNPKGGSIGTTPDVGSNAQ